MSVRSFQLPEVDEVRVTSILHNLDALSIDLSPVESIVLSHGHFDHTSGLSVLLDRFGPRRVRVVAHPDAFLERRKPRRDGVAITMPSLIREAFQRDNVEMIEATAPTLLMAGRILISGEVATAVLRIIGQSAG